MKKIMFNDKYGLTQAVLDGRKTMIMSVIKGPKNAFTFNVCRYSNGECSLEPCDGRGVSLGEIRTKYNIGEVVAVAQCYEDAILDVGEEKWNEKHKWHNINYLCHEKSLHNKMLVKSDLMPHHIKITNIRTGRLQDMSCYEDCLKEGIYEHSDVGGSRSLTDYAQHGYTFGSIFYTEYKLYETPREAFADLVDGVLGKGVWKSNPHCICYEFELID